MKNATKGELHRRCIRRQRDAQGRQARQIHVDRHRRKRGQGAEDEQQDGSTGEKRMTRRNKHGLPSGEKAQIDVWMRNGKAVER